MRPRLLLLAALPLTLLAAPTAAHACSCVFVPDAGFLASQDGPLPLNARGILWAGTSRLDPAAFRVERLDKADKATPVPFTLHDLGGKLAHVRLTDEPKPGERYRFQTSHFKTFDTTLQTQTDPKDNTPWQTVTFTVSPDSLDLHALKLQLEASPVTLDTLSAPMGASCAYQLQGVKSDLRVVLPPEAEPFRQHLVFATLLNGSTPWSPRSSLCDFVAPGRSWTDAPGTDTVYTSCKAPPFAKHAEGAPPADSTAVTLQVLFPQVSPKAALTPTVHLKLQCPDNLPELPRPKGARFP